MGLLFIGLSDIHFAFPGVISNHQMFSEVQYSACSAVLDCLSIPYIHAYKNGDASGIF